jgi:hypothetical protein
LVCIEQAGANTLVCVTEAWSIALILLACPAILSLLLVVLSVLEDSLSEPVSPSVRESVSAARLASNAPESGPVSAAPVTEGARL